MGLVGNLSASNVVVLAVVGTIAAIVLKYVNDEIKIRKLGGHAGSLPRWKLGIDFIYRQITSGKADQALLAWDYNFLNFGNKALPRTFEAYPLGKRVVLTADPENIKAVLATQFNDFGKGKEFNTDWHEFLGDGIFSTDGAEWHASRKLIRPQFLKDRVSDLEIFEDQVQILMSKLPVNKKVGMREWFLRYTLDVATDFILGESIGNMDKVDTRLSFAFSEIQRIQRQIISAGPLKPLMVEWAAYREHIKTLNDCVDPYVDAALKLSDADLAKSETGETRYNFLHALARHSKDRKEIRDQLVAVLLAGRDTTAVTLSWTFYELSRNPAFAKELQQEIMRVTEGRAPTYDDLKNMKLLQNTMNEVLRLYPVLPFNMRIALKDTTLPHGAGPDGKSPVAVLKDTPIGYSTQHMQLSEEHYPATSSTFASPLVFDPHRWENWQPKHWTYIPFNGGPRLCVGQQFALTEMGYTIVRLLQKFPVVESPMPRQQYDSLLTRLEAGNEASEKGASAGGKQFPGLRGDGKSSVRRAVEARDLKYRSDIVQGPTDEVSVIFRA